MLAAACPTALFAERADHEAFAQSVAHSVKRNVAGGGKRTGGEGEEAEAEAGAEAVAAAAAAPLDAAGFDDSEEHLLRHYHAALAKALARTRPHDG